jgi:hypothetical protein
MPFLDGLLDPHLEDPAIINRVRISIMEPTVMFLLYSEGSDGD